MPDARSRKMNIKRKRFGIFCVKEKRERRGRNPATGEAMMMAPRRIVTFRCSGKLGTNES
jgi:integration host factor subunit alpha